MIDDTQRSYQWIYRDPIGIIQGPFTGLEMQGWYEAGFFEHSLHVKREDVPYFESLDALILKVKNSKTPFLASWPPNDTFNSGFGLKSTMATPQSPFGNPPFVPSRVNRTTSPWENNNPASSSWLSNQNDPLYQNTRQPPTRQREYEADLDYQQLAMNQQMEQQYLTMLRQNQQHHIQLQQRMLQQQQQQQLLIQQQQRQQMFMGNYEQQIISPPVQQPSINRGWSSVPGTPGIVDTVQNPWSNTFNDPFVPSPPRRSRSRSPSKTQIEKDDQLAFTLNSMSLSEPTELPSISIEPEQGKFILIYFL